MSDNNITSVWDKGVSALLGNGEGVSYWQPQPTGGWATFKFTPRNLRTNAAASITQMIPPGGVIPTHGHLSADVVVYVTGGRGTLTVDGTTHHLEADTTVVVGRQVPFGLVNDSDEELHLFIWMTPAGAEDLLSWWGVPRAEGDAAPAPFERPEGWQERAQLLRVLSEEELALANPDLKGTWRVLPNDATDTYWQPAPSRGYLGMKVCTDNYPTNSFDVGEQLLCPGALIVPHAHTHNEELLLVTRGTGEVHIDGVPHAIGPGSLAIVGRWVTHTFVNTGDEDMHILAILTPPVRELLPLLKELGRLRTPGEIAPEFEMDDVESISAQYLSGAVLASPEVAAAYIAAEPAFAG